MALIGQNGGNLENASAGIQPYKVYVALLSQTGTSAPVATILENTLGAVPVVDPYSDPGTFYLVSTGLFINNKTTVIIGSGTLAGDVSPANIETKAHALDVNYIEIRTFNNGVSVNSILDKTMIEIRVYN